MQRRMHLSWLVFALGGSMGGAVDSGEQFPVVPLMYGYVCWSVYWTLPAALGLLRPYLNWKAVAALFFSGVGLIPLFVGAVLFIPVVAVLGCLGAGALYYFRYWRLARHFP